MPISAIEAEYLARKTLEIYERLELRLMNIIAVKVRMGMGSPDWAWMKLAAVRQVETQLRREINGAAKEAMREIQNSTEKAYEIGILAGAEDIKAAERLIGREFVRGQMFGRINHDVLRLLIADTYGKLGAAHLQILRSCQDIYRQIISETAPEFFAGLETRRKAAQRALQAWADKGVTGFVDRAGRQWEMASYAEMATRTAYGHATIQGHIDTLEQAGQDLVIVSNSPEECDLCRPWEGKILSISGRSAQYPSVADAEAAGMFHPNCTHRLGIYLPGYTKTMHDTENPEGYAERQKQRHIERQIRGWKRRAAVAGEPTEKAFAEGKVREWQGRMREFIRDTGRRRDYAREGLKGH